MYKGKTVVLAPFEEEDLEVYRQWVNDPLIMQQLDRATPVTAAEHYRWYQSITQDPQTVIFAMRHQDQFIGCIWLYNIHPRHHHAEVRILLGHHTYQNNGLGMDAIQTLSSVAFCHLNLNKVYAFVLETNTRAYACFRRAGFVEEGCLQEEIYHNGRYINVFRMGLLKGLHQP